jgi:hypothetical protein
MPPPHRTLIEISHLSLCPLPPSLNFSPSLISSPFISPQPLSLSLFAGAARTSEARSEGVALPGVVLLERHGGGRQPTGIRSRGHTAAWSSGAAPGREHGAAGVQRSGEAGRARMPRVAGVGRLGVDVIPCVLVSRCAFSFF